MDLILILLDACIFWALLFPSWFILVRTTKYFDIQRFLGLLILILGIVYGVIRKNQDSNDIIENARFITFGPIELFQNSKLEAISWINVFILIYLIGVTLVLGKLLFNILKLYSSFRGYREQHLHGVKYVETAFLHAPYSFYNRIFLSADYTYDDEEYKAILNHEKAHISQKHTFDLVFVEILLAFTWFLPVVYLYKKVMTEIHEYIADHHILQFMDKKQYGEILITQALGGGLGNVHYFSGSDLKLRFSKMVSADIKSSSIWLLFIFPMTIFSLMLMPKMVYSKPISSIVEGVLGSDGTVILKNFETGSDSGFDAPIIPKYDGGSTALKNYIVKELANMQMDESDLPENILVQLRIDAFGRVKMVNIFHIHDEDLKEKLEQLFLHMPHWIPATKGLISVESEIELPIQFKSRPIE